MKEKIQNTVQDFLTEKDQYWPTYCNMLVFSTLPACLFSVALNA